MGGERRKSQNEAKLRRTCSGRKFKPPNALATFPALIWDLTTGKGSHACQRSAVSGDSEPRRIVAGEFPIEACTVDLRKLTPDARGESGRGSLRRGGLATDETRIEHGWKQAARNAPETGNLTKRSGHGAIVKTRFLGQGTDVLCARVGSRVGCTSVPTWGLGPRAFSVAEGHVSPR